jgi:two-component system chemotaxis response regulator CheB
VIGGSAGGIEGLRPLLASLPRDFAAPVCIVFHVTPTRYSNLPTLFQRTRSVAGVASRYARSRP